MPKVAYKFARSCQPGIDFSKVVEETDLFAPNCSSGVHL